MRTRNTPRIAEGAVPRLPINSVLGSTRSIPYVPAKVADNPDTTFCSILSTIARIYHLVNGKYITANE